MNRRPDAHLSLDDLDAWLAGHLGQSEQAHLDACDECRDTARTERILARHLAALTAFSPSAGFADRVMASVAVPDPFALRSMQSARRRLFGTRKAIAAAAMIAVVVLGSMAASVGWSLSHPQAIAAAGTWISGTAAAWAWGGMRALVSGIIQQPWYAGLREALGSPARLAAISALLSLAYVSGLFALRKLMAVPSGPVSHARA